MADTKTKLIDKVGLSYYHQNTVAPMLNATYTLGQSLLAMQEDFNSAEYWDGIIDVNTRVISGSVATKKSLPSSGVKAGTYYQTTKELLVENNTEHEVLDTVFDYYELPANPGTGDVYKVTSPVEAYYRWSGSEWNAVTGEVVPVGTIYKFDGSVWSIEEDDSNFVDLSSYAKRDELEAFEGSISIVTLAEAESWFDD